MAHDILIIDDEADIRDLVSDILKDEGYKTRVASDSVSAFAAINEKVPTVVILDIWLQGSELDGLGILEILKKKYPYLQVVMISGHGTIETAVNAIKMGAYDYVEKPFTADKLSIVVKRACQVAKLQKENEELRSKIPEKFELIGNSQSMQNLKAIVEKVAPTSSRVLISGPQGVGKELIAKMLHKKSKRMGEPFFKINLFGIAPERIELELFGEAEKTGINNGPRKVGILELANHGTLFIDEIANIPLPIQCKLLKVLQEQSFERSGSSKQIKLDIRFISSTSQDIEELIKAGKFRQDLYNRLNVININVPSLSSRKDDIPILCEYFLRQISKGCGLPYRTLRQDTIIAMQTYKWPYNVRQLKNVIEHLLIVSKSMQPGAQIPSDLLSLEIMTNNSTTGTSSSGAELSADIMSLPLREAREIFERQYLIAQMNRFNGNISRTSTFVGMERSALHRKLKSLNVTMSSNNDENLVVSNSNLIKEPTSA